MSMTTSTTNRMDLQIVPLANGSTLYYQPKPGAPRIALGIYLYGGNRIEPRPGVADMIDDLLCEGTEKRSAEDIAIALDSLSLDMDTDTRRDYSSMTATFLEEDMDASLDLLADMLFHSTMKEFDKERIRLEGELMMDLDSPRNLAHDLFMTSLMEKTPYQASHTRMLETLQTLTQVEPLQTHYRAAYHPANMIFSVVGDIPLPAIQTALERHFAFDRSAGTIFRDTNPPQGYELTENRYVSQARDESNQLHIFRGWFGPPLHHPDYWPMVVLNTILGGAGLTSRLFLELRDKQGLAYMVRSQYEASKYLGLFSMYIGTEPNNREKALTGFDVECRKLIDTAIGAQELAEAKENILGRRVVYLETAGQQCSYIGSMMISGAAPESLDTFTDNICAVTSQQVKEAAQRYLTRPNVTAAVGPQQFL